MRTRLLAVVVALLLVGVLVGPAAATPADSDGHTVMICHVTNSVTNPYVVIEVDVAAFDGEGVNDHSHHSAKDGRMDVVWSPVEGCDGGGPL